MDASIIGFASGKGGTGKSTTAVFLGGALAAMGKKVLLIELDYGLRSVDIIAGISGQSVFDLGDVLSGRCAPAKAMVESPLYPGLLIIPASYENEVPALHNLELLCQKFRPYFDFILLDSAAGLGTPFRAMAQAAQQVLLVLTPDPVALRDGRVASDELDEYDKKQRLILNRVDAKRIAASESLTDLDEAIDIVGVQLLGVVPESNIIQTSGATGKALPGGSTEQAVYEAIALRLTGKEAPLVIK